MCVILIGFPNTPNTFDPDEIRDAVWGNGRSANMFYQEGSRGQMWLEGIDDKEGGDVFGPVTVNTNGCADMEFGEISDDARIQVGAGGYDYYVYYFPPRAAECPGGGVGGGNSVVIFGVGINGTWDYVAHETAHCFGLGHASSSTNCSSRDGDVVTYGGSCGHDEYGDMTDIMGGRNFQFCSWHLERLGWLQPSNIKVLERSERVTLYPIELDLPGIQSLRVPRGDNEFFHFEFRQQVGFDEGLETELTNGVLVRVTADPADRGNPHIIDMTPGNNFSDATLTEGSTFVDDGLEVTTIEVTDEYAVVDVIIEDEQITPIQKSQAAKEHFTFTVAGAGTVFQLPLSDEQTVNSVEIIDPHGRSLDKLRAEQGNITWDGLSRDGSPLANGVYVLKFDRGNETIAKKVIMVR
jgi:hypothetical protein